MFDLIAFSQTTQNNGYDYVAPAAGEDFYAVSGDDLKVIDGGKVDAAIAIDATTTKGARWRFKAKTQADWNESTAISLDSGIRSPGLIYTGLQIPPNAVLNAQLDNLNTNEISSVLLFYLKKGQGVTHVPPALPPGAIWIKGIFTTACVAITWTDMLTGTWSYNFDQNRKYKIIGMQAASASGLACRLKGKTGSSPDLLACRPGTYATYELTEVNGPAMYFVGMDLTFQGANPPTPQFLATTTDSSQKVDLLIVPM